MKEQTVVGNNLLAKERVRAHPKESLRMDRFSVIGNKMSAQPGELHHGRATARVLKCSSKRHYPQHKNGRILVLQLQ